MSRPAELSPWMAPFGGREYRPAAPWGRLGNSGLIRSTRYARSRIRVRNPRHSPGRKDAEPLRNPPHQGPTATAFALIAVPVARDDFVQVFDEPSLDRASTDSEMTLS